MHPYESLPARSFWRTAVAERAAPALTDLWTPAFAIDPDEPLLTAGSCFARHLGPALLLEGMNWCDAEIAPPGLTAAEREARWYGQFSFRTGNIYTAAALRQWLAWAFEESPPPDEVWEEDGRFYDPHRPAVEPDGHVTPEAVRAARQRTLAAIRTAVSSAGCLIFTLGLTEAWLDAATGIAYPVCPGTVRGSFDAGRHVFHNFTVAEVHRDLTAAVSLARRANPGLRVLLTVSPVPLTATATAGHALVATTYSKSVLRAAAGQLAQELDHVDYFPSYEIITGHPFKGAFYEPNQRTVSADGVAFVMRHFFDALHGDALHGRRETAQPAADPARTDSGEDHWCDDAVLDYYNPVHYNPGHYDRGPVPPAR
ncbi:GSCFA domain-containing protein [Streptomyces sp. NBC_01136]|uniref:GSCFA domain-containing protein n=1 Tax=Streptomyces sp. NBC_01136 TaxID=2903754 RepID=UPI00386D9149|nr:GSCFA domain-containing protein [Streptomyces sp. NBC_01136]